MKPYLKSTSILITIILVWSCEKQSFNDSFQFLYCDWEPIVVEAPWAIPTTEWCETFRIERPNNYSFISNGKELESGTIDIKEQSDNSLRFELKRKYKSDSYVSILTLYIYNSDLFLEAYSSDSIRIRNTVMDGGYFSSILIKK